MSASKPPREHAPPPTDESAGLFAPPHTGAAERPLQEAFDKLQKELDNERRKRRTEMFLWIFALFLIVDTFVFVQMESWAGPLSLGALQLVALLCLARYLEFDIIWALFERVIEKWPNREGK